MSEDTKSKKIFIENIDDQPDLYEFLHLINVEVVDDAERKEEAKWEVYSEKEDVEALSFTPVDSVAKFLQNGGRGIISPQLKGQGIADVVFSRFFEEHASLDPSAEIANHLDETFTLKITNPLTIGYYIDLITERAVVNKFNFIAIRNCINAILSFSSYMKKAGLVEVPFEIDYGYSENVYYIQISLRGRNFFIDHLIDGLNKEDLNNPYYSLMNTACENSNLFEIFSIEKGSKICFSNIWFNDENLQLGFPSLLVHKVFTFKEYNLNPGLAGQINIDMQGLNNDRVMYPGGGTYQYLDENKQARSKNLILIKAVVSHLDKERHDGGDDLAIFTMSHYEKYIPTFSDQEKLERLEPDDITNIINCLNNDRSRERLTEEVNIIKDNLTDDNYAENILGGLDSLIEENETISSVTDEINEDVSTVRGTAEEEDDFEQSFAGDREEREEIQSFSGESGDDHDVTKVSGVENDDDDLVKISGGENDDDDLVKVSGGDRDATEDIQRIKGQVEEEDKSKMVIKGGKAPVDKEKEWRIKSSAAAEKVKESVMRLKSSGASPQEINKEIKKVVAEEFGDDKAGVQRFFENVSDDAADEVVSQQEVEKTSMFDHIQVDLDIELPIDDDAIDPRQMEMLEQAVSMRDQQILKMKKLVDRMKREVDREREATKIVNEAGAEGSGAHGEKLRDYVTQVSNMKNATMAMEKEMNSLRNNLSKAIKTRDAMERQFERDKALLEKKLSDYELDGDGESDVSVKDILKENDSLSRQVDDLKKKMTVMFENNRKANDEVVSSSEYNRVKKDYNDAVSKMNIATDEKKAAVDQSKSLMVKLKASEQRYKNLALKVEKSQSSNKTSDDSGGDAKSAHRVKHLEKTNERLQALNKKVGDELSEKKTELHKSNMEVKTLQAKIKELEKKIGKMAA